MEELCKSALTLATEMTDDEKIRLTSGADFWHSEAVDRLGVQSVTMSDGPHGLRKQVETKGDHMGLNEAVEAVCFPAACATACSFNRRLLKQMGTLLGEECLAEQVHVLLGPAVNIKRSPLCGRNFEYFSEDPLLAGELSAAYIQGVQGKGVGVSLKHFAANNQESERMSSSSEISEQALREIYLAAFELAVKKAKPWTVMCSYNKINGVFACENPRLLTDMLRREWGFDGVVVSDWGAVRDRVAGLKAGMELEMPSSNHTNDEKLKEALQTGELGASTLTEAARRMVQLSKRVHQADGTEAVFDREAHHKEAVRIAEESMVLLKNEHRALPLSESEKVAVIGGFAFHPRYQGGGSSNIHAHRVPTVPEAAKDIPNITYTMGFSAYDEQVSGEEMQKAVDAAKAADKIVVFAGLPESYESESFDRTHMQLPLCQNMLIERLAALNKPLIVVLQNGSPVEMPWNDRVSAILEAYLGGEGVSEAVVDLLYGRVNPCGKLAESFPVRLCDNPSYLSYPGKHHRAVYSEGIFVGYRYYDKKKMDVRYPFGHGLSYTEFLYSDLRLSDRRMEKGGELTVSFTVTNAGNRAGREVVQLYLSDRTGVFIRPEQELRDFACVDLQAGESKRLSFTLTDRAFSCWSEEQNDFYAPNGMYELRIGASSRDIRLREKVEFSGSKALPLEISMDVMVGELLADPRTAEYVRRELSPKLKALTGDSDGDSFGEMVEAMIRDMPLRSLRSFAGLTNAQLEETVADLRRLTEAE